MVSCGYTGTTNILLLMGSGEAISQDLSALKHWQILVSKPLLTCVGQEMMVVGSLRLKLAPKLE
jgi:hypothetical protein